MFAIVSGLDHKTVQRLQATWERVSDKYKKLFEVRSRSMNATDFLSFSGAESAAGSLSKHVRVSKSLEE